MGHKLLFAERPFAALALQQGGRTPMVLVPINTERRSVTINEDVCERVAVLLKNQSVPEDREEIQFVGFSVPETSNLLFSIVAICHQTSVVGRPTLQGTVRGSIVR